MKIQPNVSGETPRAPIGLASQPFLQDLSPGQIDTLAELTTDHIFATGDFLCREGQPAETFHLLREGRVSLEVHVPEQAGVRIATLHAGDVLGWSWLVPPHRWRLDARALEPVRTFAIDATRLRRQCEMDHDLGYKILTRLSGVIGQRLHATRMQLLGAHGRAKAGVEPHGA